MNGGPQKMCQCRRRQDSQDVVHGGGHKEHLVARTQTNRSSDGSGQPQVTTIGYNSVGYGLCVGAGYDHLAIHRIADCLLCAPSESVENNSPCRNSPPGV